MDSDIAEVFNVFKPRNVELLGQVTDVSSAIRKADVFVLPSISDASPAVVPEAMASGVPIIISDACGPSSIIDNGVEGFVYQYKSVVELGNYMLWCFNNREKLEAMGKAARVKILREYKRRDFSAKLLDKIRTISSEDYK